MIRSVFVTAGYPSPDRPNSGIFIHRSIKAMKGLVDVDVIQLRALKPGRRLIVRREWDGVQVTSISLPQIPFNRTLRLNTLLLTHLGLNLTKSQISLVDVVHSTGIYPVGYVAGYWSMRAKVAHVTQAIGTDVNIYLTDGIAPSKGEWWTWINGVICNSTAIRDQLLSLRPDLPNVKVIHRGVDTENFKPDGICYGPQVGLASVRFLYLGGFQTWQPDQLEQDEKGGHVLLKAWQLAESHFGESSLTIGGPNCNIARLNRWRAQLAQGNRVFLLGLQPPDRVAALIRASEVVIVPSLKEGLPNIANEAQACARPVLGTNAGGIPESVVDGVTGRIVLRGNVAELADGLIWFYRQREMLANYGNAARLRMLQEFNSTKSSQQMVDLFQQVIDQRKQQKP